MPSNTKFRPNNENQFDSDQQRVNLLASSGLVQPNETKSIDLVLADDHLLQGVEKFLVYNGHKDDTVTLQIVHPAIGVVPEGQFVTENFIDPTQIEQDFSVPSYSAKVPAGLIIRCVYKAANAGTEREVKINWLLHKVLA